MYMVVALLVWAVWITKKRIQNAVYRIQHFVDNMDPAGSRFTGAAGFLI
jgi:hypothetical protein